MSIGIAIGQQLGGTGFVAFNAATVANLALWYDATRIVGLNDGDPVTTWSDLSGNARHATQASGPAKPTYKTGIQAGKPIVRFDGGDALATASIAWASATAITVFTVYSTTSAGTNEVILESGNGGASPGTWYAGFRTTSNDLRSNFLGNVGATECRGGSLPTGVVLASTVMDTSLATNEVLLWVNGVLTTTHAANADNSSGLSDQVLNIGARAGTSLFLIGDMAEILIYARALTNTERFSVQTYLKSKWGTP